MWYWKQAAGTLSRNGATVSRGYSGNGRGKNNPTMQAAVGVGPIPRGVWKLVRLYDSANVGKAAIELHAVDATPGNDTHDPTGRGAFRIHGDSVRNPGTASHGCIILPREIRLRMWGSGDRDLTVEA